VRFYVEYFSIIFPVPSKIFPISSINTLFFHIPQKLIAFDNILKDNYHVGFRTLHSKSLLCSFQIFLTVNSQECTSNFHLKRTNWWLLDAEKRVLELEMEILGFEIPICYLLAVQFWTHYITSINFSFITYRKAVRKLIFQGSFED
jgi:hypothetical protein